MFELNLFECHSVYIICMKHQKIILLRGLFRGKYHWGDFPEQLKYIFPFSDIQCLDIQGNGALSHELSAMHIQCMVEQIRSQLHFPQKVIVIAISMGGMIGLKWAEMYPDEIKHLVCINTSAKGFSKISERLFPKNYFILLKALFSESFKRESLVYQLVSNRPLNLKIIQHWADMSCKYPLKKRNFFRQLFAASQFVPLQPNVPVTFIASRQDRLVSFKATSAMAKAWDCPLIENDVDGHDIPLDNPEWLLQQLKSVLLKHYSETLDDGSVVNSTCFQR